MDKIIDDNNKIVGNINLDNSNIKFIGKNNILYVDNGITLVNSSIEFRGDNSLVYLCKTNDKLTIDVKIYNNSTLYFGKNMWINKGIKIVISEETNVFFGCDCLVSYDTCIRTGDPHIIYVIDTIEYDYKLSTYKENREGLDKELMLFLIDNYFDDFVFSNSVLREMYLEFEVRGIDFMREFRKMISEYIGEDVVYLNKAKSLVKKNNNPVYYREFLGGSIYE